LRADVDVAELLCTWTAVVNGVISQPPSNAPIESFDESFDEGRFTTLLPHLVEMYIAHYTP